MNALKIKALKAMLDIRHHIARAASGQGLVEYALILVLIALVVVVVMMLLGPVIGNVFSKINCSLQGGRCGKPIPPIY